MLVFLLTSDFFAAGIAAQVCLLVAPHSPRYHSWGAVDETGGHMPFLGLCLSGN